ncbi:MAG TPA: hypothetical protein PLZ08_12700 [Bacillota bacterium]|jgi:hypothetical protein|nr:hypothetical protein [Bacillota bacterium]HOL11030.1 hypothetical protein [Bacillota bacterium]HPO98797.1 hypothetical protein [Bacillota bacterium]
MKFKFILVIILVPILIAILTTSCFYRDVKIKVVTEINPAQVKNIQEEFGFVLPENSAIIQCRLGLPRDWPFSVAIAGITDIEEFIQNNLYFKVEKSHKIQHFAYDNAECTQPDQMITADYYLGFYNGSKREIYIYETVKGMIVEIEKEGVVAKDLLKMFGE